MASKSNPGSDVASYERSVIKRTGLGDAVAAARTEARNSGLPGLHNGPADAYRHILIAGELARRKGPVMGFVYATGHELANLRQGQPGNEFGMDFRNNLVGWWIGNKAKTWEDVVEMARQSISEAAGYDGDGEDGRAGWNLKPGLNWRPKWAGVPTVTTPKGGPGHRYPGTTGYMKDLAEDVVDGSEILSYARDEISALRDEISELFYPPKAGRTSRRPVRRTRKTAASLQSRIDELTDLMHSDPDRYKSRAVQDELTGLYARLHGTGAISDPEGRSALR